MSDNMSSNNSAYQAAADKYRQLNEDNTKAALKANREALASSLAANQMATNKAVQGQKAFLEELNKKDIYGDSFKRASKAAEGQAASAGAQAQKAARQAGMSKAAAAEAGANARQGALSGALGQQQQNAMNATMNKLGMKQSGVNSMGNTLLQGAGQAGSYNMGAAGNTINTLGQQTANQGALASQLMQEGQNKYNRSWNNFAVPMGALGGVLQAFSDENLKDAQMNNDKWSHVENILKKYQKPDLKDLIIKKEEK